MSEEEFSLEELQRILEVLQGKTREESVAQAIEDLSNEEKIMFFSDLHPSEIPRFACFNNISKRYEKRFLKDYILDELKLRVSIDRRGRKEIVSIASSRSITERIKRILPFGRKEAEETPT